MTEKFLEPLVTTGQKMKVMIQHTSFNVWRCTPAALGQKKCRKMFKKIINKAVDKMIRKNTTIPADAKNIGIPAVSVYYSDNAAIIRVDTAKSDSDFEPDTLKEMLDMSVSEILTGHITQENDIIADSEGNPVSDIDPETLAKYEAAKKKICADIDEYIESIPSYTSSYPLMHFPLGYFEHTPNAIDTKWINNENETFPRFKELLEETDGWRVFPNMIKEMYGKFPASYVVNVAYRYVVERNEDYIDAEAGDFLIQSLKNIHKDSREEQKENFEKALSKIRQSNHENLNWGIVGKSTLIEPGYFFILIAVMVGMIAQRDDYIPETIFMLEGKFPWFNDYLPALSLAAYDLYTTVSLSFDESDDDQDLYAFNPHMYSVGMGNSVKHYQAFFMAAVRYYDIPLGYLFTLARDYEEIEAYIPENEFEEEYVNNRTKHDRIPIYRRTSRGCYDIYTGEHVDVNAMRMASAKCYFVGVAMEDTYPEDDD